MLMIRISSFIKGIVGHRVSRNASWIFLGQGANFLLQAGYFILLARLLGVYEYGVFAGAFALVNAITPYSALGAGMLFMRYVTIDREEARVYWGNTLVITFLMSILIAVVFFFLGPVITKISHRSIFVVLVFANCLFSQIANLASMVFQTFEKMRLTATLSFLANLARFLILLVMQFTLHHATAVQWAYGVLGASACAAVVSIIWVRSAIGSFSCSPKLILRRIPEGFSFSFAGTTQAVYNDIDKTMLSHYGLNRENGFYTLAYRIIDFTTTPIVAMDSAILPRYFQLSREGMSPVIRLVIKSVRISILLGFVIAAGTLLLAPVVPHIVGRDFSGVLVALRWLCWLPLLRGIHRMTGSALTGSGYQNERTAAQFLAAAVNVVLNFLWIPAYGWIGAAWSSVAADGLLAVLNPIILLWASRRISRNETAVIVEVTES
ncbi:flippase [Acidobacterium sp. S8]|uniref:flippase n=1 Tax=Acidobacterium sp. S8 TaxID=1641854 RepID=UPI00131E6600|nr:flippase [Acidobacterium sp. S8]